MEQKPTNKFRDEIAKQTPEEMIRRDQKVLLLQLRRKKAMLALDRQHMTDGIANLKDFKAELAALPISDGGQAVIENINKQIEQLEKQLETVVFGSRDNATLAALKVIFAGDDKIKPEEESSLDLN